MLPSLRLLRCCAVEPLFGLPALVVLAVLGLNSVKVTSGGQSRLVERLGRYDRQLQPGLSLVLPVVERVVSHESLKERVLDIPPQQCITRDNVAIEVDAVVYWQLLEHARAYYAVDNLQAAMVNLVLTQIRAEMGKLDLDQTFTTRSEVNEVLLKEPVSGNSTFSKTFQERGPKDKEGRSLRDFDLQKRIFKYPVSYMIYSSAFDSLPAYSKDRIYRRLYDVLSGTDTGKKFASLDEAARKAAIEIVAQTRTGVPAYWK